jgi:hypothetical protein
LEPALLLKKGEKEYMRKLAEAAVTILLAAGLAGCAGQGKPAPDLHLDLSHSSFSLKQWKMDGSHIVGVTGKLVSGDQPVTGAVLRAGESKKNIVTDDKGDFEFLVDQSLLAHTKVTVVSLDHAKIGDEAIASELTAKTSEISSFIDVYYPIEITKTAVSAKDSSQVEVQGRLVPDQGAAVGYFQEDKYKIGGVVKNADGRPVQDAVVHIDRDTGEGFAKSTPTDANGHYTIYYLPEQDEETNLSVSYNSVKYTLPANKVYQFPDGTSVNIDITLPATGTVIDDKPPALVSRTAPGALYSGIVVGLDVGKDVAYTVTIPDKTGNFILTVPKNVWDKSPAFVETHMTKFIEKGQLTAGAALPSSFIEASDKYPKGIKATIK